MIWTHSRFADGPNTVAPTEWPASRVRPGAGCARYIGRVGALALALGIGAAVSGGTGAAMAETGTTDTSVHESPSDPASTTSGLKGRVASPTLSATPTETGGPRGPETSDAADTADSEQGDQPSEQDSPSTGAPGGAEVSDGDPSDTTEDVDTGIPEDTGAMPPAATETGVDTEFTRPGTHRRTVAPVVDRTPLSHPVVIHRVLSEQRVDRTVVVSTPDTAPEDTAEPASEVRAVAEDPGGTVTLAGLNDVVAQPVPTAENATDDLQTISRAFAAPASSDWESTTIPHAPMQIATLTGFLEWLRRELEYRLFNKTPTMNYDPAATVRNDEGQIVGTVGGTDADGDVLTYRVSAAARNGSVTVGPGGVFTYTPNAALASHGGTDTFAIAASDVPGNRFHLHGLNTLLAPNAGSTATAWVSVVVPPAGATDISPLGTAGQLGAERLATRIVNSPLVKMAKAILKWSWLATARKKFALVGGPDAENLAQLDRAVHEYALQAAFELQLLNPNKPGVIQQVMPPHTWYGQSFGGARILFDNPDTIYRMIPVNNASSYVISGQFFDQVPTETTFSVLTGLTGTTTQVIMGRDLVLDSEKRFTISVDARAGDPDNPNHLRLPSGATLIAARNTLGDWNTETPMSLSVERVGGPANNLLSQLGFYDIPVLGPLLTANPLISRLVSAIPALSPMPLWLQQAETAIVMALGLIMEPQYIGVATEDPDTGQPKPPNTLSDPTHNASFLATQQQSAGYFQLADDEALVITIDPGNAGYFIVPVTNDWTITDNYWDAQTSLNNFQATPNADGQTYTIVVSPTDPRVANWVSTGGLNQGTLSIRFQDLDLSSPLRPSVSTRVVPVAEVLPPGDPPFSEAQRAAQIALRQAGYNRRYAPYPQTV